MKVIISQIFGRFKKNTAPWHFRMHIIYFTQAKIGTTDVASVCREAGLFVFDAYKCTKMVYSLTSLMLLMTAGINGKLAKLFNYPLFRYQATVPLEVILINTYEYIHQY